MPPASRELPPSGLLSEGKDSPRAPSAPPHPAQACACTGYGGSVGVGHPFSGCRNGAAGKLFFKERRIRNAPPTTRPTYKSLGRERDGGAGEGGGKPFSRRVPSPFPRISKCYLHHGALPLSQRELSACASRKVSMHCQKPVWRYMESWPSAARRSSGSFSRSQDSSSER